MRVGRQGSEFAKDRQDAAGLHSSILYQQDIAIDQEKNNGYIGRFIILYWIPSLEASLNLMYLERNIFKYRCLSHEHLGKPLASSDKVLR